MKLPRYNVFLDVSSLPRHPSHLGLAFERLAQLSQAGLVKVYISKVAVEEWRTQLAREWADTIRSSYKALRDALRHPWSSRLANPQILSRALQELSTRGFRLAIHADQAFDELLSELAPTILEVSSDHGRQVLEAYFRGYPPFSVPKSRDDIPDAFIYRSALDLLSSIDGSLECIVADKGLRNALSVIESITTHKDLASFIFQSDVVQLARELDPAQTWRAAPTTLLRSLAKYEDTLLGQMEDMLLDALPKERVFHEGIPDDNNEAIPTEIHEPTDIEFAWRNAQDYEAGLVTLPFGLLVDLGIGFPVYRGDAYAVPPGVSVDYADPEFQHYFDAEGTVTARISGTLALRFDLAESDFDGLPILSNISLHEIDPILVLELEPGRIFHVSGDEPGEHYQAEP